MLSLNYTHQGKRPSTRQILADWKRAGKPAEFAVEYGETFGRFELYLGRWIDSGNGCRGVKRDEVLDRLNADEQNGDEANTRKPKQKPINTYRVTWAIDVSATSAREAAEMAQAAQCRPGTLATIYEVQRRSDQGQFLKRETIDLYPYKQEN